MCKFLEGFQGQDHSATEKREFIVKPFNHHQWEVSQELSQRWKGTSPPLMEFMVFLTKLSHGGACQVGWRSRFQQACRHREKFHTGCSFQGEGRGPEQRKGGALQVELPARPKVLGHGIAWRAWGTSWGQPNGSEPAEGRQEAASANVSQVTTPFTYSFNEHLLRTCSVRNYVLHQNSHSIGIRRSGSNKYNTWGK